MKEQMRILLVDDDEEEYLLLKDMIDSSPKRTPLRKFDLHWTPKYEEAVQAFSNCEYDLYLVDYQLGNRNALDLLSEDAARKYNPTVIMLTGNESYKVDLAAMQLGASDYLVKGQLTLPLLERSIRYVVERKQVEKDLERLVHERTLDMGLLKKQAKEMKSLQKATSSLLNTLDLSLLMGQILDAAQEAIPAAEWSQLHLIHQRNSTASQLIETGWEDPRIGIFDWPENWDSPLKLVLEGQSILIDDIQTGSWLSSFPGNEADNCAMRSAIIAPLVKGHEVIGALLIGSSQPATFVESDMHLLTSFAVTATAAIYNAILHRQVQNLATTDPLTGQLNRRALFEFGEHEIERFQRLGRDLSLIMIDVDHFKAINDNHGHAAGDQVLCAIVERCCAIIRNIDILARYGGDEFALLLPEADQDRAMLIANRIRKSISETPVETDTGSISVTISMGIAQATNAITNLSSLLNLADQALYQCKQAGRNCIEAIETLPDSLD